MQPGDIYILAITLTALVVAPFNGLARVIVLSWLVGHVAWISGMPEPWANLLGQFCVMTLGAKHNGDHFAFIAWLMSIPLIIVNVVWLLGAVEPALAWRIVLVLAGAQLLVLPLAINMSTLRAVTRAWHDNADGGLFREASQ